MSVCLPVPPPAVPPPPRCADVCERAASGYFAPLQTPAFPASAVSVPCVGACAAADATNPSSPVRNNVGLASHRWRRAQRA